jgi:hypothetical protein
MKKLLQTVILLAMCIAMPSLAFARGALEDDAAADFADSDTVQDKDLATMRGGFSYGGMDINFSYNSVVALNGNLQNSVSITSEDIQNAINNGSANIPSIPATSVVQNVDNNTLISIQQQLNLTVTNAGAQASSNALLHQAVLQNAQAFK